MSLAGSAFQGVTLHSSSQHTISGGPQIVKPCGKVERWLRGDCTWISAFKVRLLSHRNHLFWKGHSITAPSYCTKVKLSVWGADLNPESAQGRGRWCPPVSHEVSALILSRSNWTSEKNEHWTSTSMTSTTFSCETFGLIEVPKGPLIEWMNLDFS